MGPRNRQGSLFSGTIFVHILTAIPLALFAATALAGPPAPINGLGDEMDSPATLANWTRIRDAEAWDPEQLEHLDISTSRTGWMTLMPYTCTWYEDYRGPFLFKEVTGDYVATARISSSNRAQTAAPSRIFSLTGILSRTPRAITQATWTPGGENYTFLSIGCGGDAGNFQFEVKETINSSSALIYQNTNDGGEAIIQTARLGQYYIHLRKTPNGVWTVHRRYSRPDMPATMQVGLFCYTDWPTVSTYTPAIHNVTDIRHAYLAPGTPAVPDLISEVDYVRFQRPEIPAPLVGADFSTGGPVTDGELLAFLGDNANAPAPPTSVPGWEVYQ